MSYPGTRHQQDRRAPPELRAVGTAARLDAIPHPLTPLIGRRTTADAIESLLRQEHVRLLTLAGSGGIGKSRLALHVAAEMRDAYADGVVFVPLASIPHATLVPASIAGAVGLRDAPERNTTETLHAFFRNRHVLLIVDNFEHLLAAGQFLVDLLQACPRLNILVTSRSTLRLGGEQVFPVHPLSLVENRVQPATPADVMQSEAGQLFVRQATAIDPGFRLSDLNAPAIAQICDRLDGIPLAIELAAARTRTLSPAALLEWLSKHVLIPEESEHYADQFQALHLAIDSSYAMLTHRAQSLFRSLSVFAGGFSLEAAIAIADDGDEASMPIALESLLDNSLLQRETRPDGEHRFTMLETIRASGLHRLDTAGEMELVSRRHASWCVDLAERTPLGMMGDEDKLVYERLELEHDNLRRAMNWSLDHDNVETCFRVANAIWSYWQHKGHLTEGIEWFDRALQASTGTPAPLRARALLGRAFLAYSRGDLVQSQTDAHESHRLYLELQKPVGIGFSLLCLALVAEESGHVDGAISLLIEALDLFRQEGHEFFTAHVLMTIGRLNFRQNQRQLAEVRYTEALSIQRALGNRMTMALTLDALAELAHDRGQTETAMSRYLEALGLWQELDHGWGAAESLAGIARIAARQGAWELAANLCGATDAICLSAGVSLPPLARREYARTMAAVRSGIGSRSALAVRDAGMSLDWDQVLERVAVVATGKAGTGAPSRSAVSSIPLTQRESQVLQLLLAGHSNQAIAEALFVSVPTVKVHVGHIMDKYGVRSRAAIVAMAHGEVHHTSHPPGSGNPRSTT